MFINKHIGKKGLIYAGILAGTTNALIYYDDGNYPNGKKFPPD